MKRIMAVASGAFLLQAGVAFAQNTLQTLQQELNEAGQQHQDATSQSLANFFSQVDQAMASPDAAVALYQAAGGQMPAATPVNSAYTTETATEKEARLAQDQANTAAVGNVLMIHCGLLHYGALFVTQPDKKGLQDDFNAWLQRAAQAYPQLGVIKTTSPVKTPEPDANGQPKHHHQQGAGGGGGGTGGFGLGDLKGKTLKDSIISSYLGFKLWADKDQGTWCVKDIPKLYKADVLDPSRTPPSQTTLQNWDLYIAMKSADQPDTDKWDTTDYPPLQFDRACDDFLIAPGSEKLEGLIQIIHANPTHPKADDWLARAKDLLADYSAKHGGAPAITPNATAPAPSNTVTNSNVTVTTIQQGDATIITTHTNAAPNPAPPQ